MTKVLIVDDSLFMRKHFAKQLEEQGYEVATARDGEEAIATYKEEHPDVVLMDVTMPRKTGLQALEEIRALDSQAKVIVITALDQKSIAARAIRAGAKDFLIKPVSPQKLLKTLAKVTS
jgi:two-component system chemotaxis response regulator CheY